MAMSYFGLLAWSLVVIRASGWVAPPPRTAVVGGVVRGSTLRRIGAEESSTEPPPPQPGLGKKCVVLGASGQTGRKAVRSLLDRGFDVVAGVRDSSKADKELAQDARVTLLSMDIVEDSPAQLARHVKGTDAVICATGFTRRFPPDPTGPLRVEYLGVKKLVDACADARVPKFVLVSSILTNGLASGQALNPAFLALNLLGGTLLLKRQAEKYIEGQAFLDWTIVRPGGLKDADPSGEILFSSADTLSGGSISRAQVAEVAVEAILQPGASRKIVEVVASEDVPAASFADGMIQDVQVSGAGDSEALQQYCHDNHLDPNAVDLSGAHLQETRAFKCGVSCFALEQQCTFPEGQP